MIRIVTDQAIAVTLVQHRKDLAAQFADEIELMLPLPCDHRNRPSCARCAERRTVQAAARVVRETGGVAR